MTAPDRRIVKITAILAFPEPEPEDLEDHGFGPEWEPVTSTEDAKQALIENACDDCVTWEILWSDDTTTTQ
jgi:hypothetical protein